MPLGDEAGVEGLGSGSTVGLLEVAAFALFDGVADRLPAGVWLLQLADGVGLLVSALPAVLVLVLALGLADGCAEALGLALPVALPLGVALALALPVALPLGVVLALVLALSLGLAVLLAWDGLDGLCCVVALGLVGWLADAAGLAAPDFAEPEARGWVGDGHGATDGAVVLPSDALPPKRLAPGE